MRLLNDMFDIFFSLLGGGNSEPKVVGLETGSLKPASASSVHLSLVVGSPLRSPLDGLYNKKTGHHNDWVLISVIINPSPYITFTM